jgi:prepilin-type N-terminal cleavage/methylation domain-containing protein
VSKKLKYKVKGFTITEVLVTLALTSIAITMAYGTMTYIQKLFYNYKDQNRFINEYTSLKKRMDFESLNAKMIVEEGENKFVIKRDSLNASLEFRINDILFKKGDRCDTFHISAKNIQKDYEVMKNPLWTGKLVNTLKFEVQFTKQKFNFYFYKNYDSSVKMELDKEE